MEHFCHKHLWLKYTQLKSKEPLKKKLHPLNSSQLLFPASSLRMENTIRTTVVRRVFSFCGVEWFSLTADGAHQPYAVSFLWTSLYWQTVRSSLSRHLHTHTVYCKSLLWTFGELTPGYVRPKAGASVCRVRVHRIFVRLAALADIFCSLALLDSSLGATTFLTAGSKVTSLLPPVRSPRATVSRKWQECTVLNLNLIIYFSSSTSRTSLKIQIRASDGNVSLWLTFYSFWFKYYRKETYNNN